MATLDKMQRNSMYRSHCPTITNPTSTTISTLNFSMISADSPQPQPQTHKQNHLTYRYQRIDNMFKLVQVKPLPPNPNPNPSIGSNKSIRSNNSDPKQQPVFEDDKLQKIYDVIQDLTNRIISLELQQAKIPGLERKVTECGAMGRSFQLQGKYLSEKINGFNQEIRDIKDRLEEVEEQGGSYEKEFGDIFKLMKEIKEEASKAMPEYDQRYEALTQNLRFMIQQQIEKLSNSLKQHQNFTNKFPPTSSYTSSSPTHSPFTSPFPRHHSPQNPQKLPQNSPNSPHSSHSPQSPRSPHHSKPLKLKYRETYQLDDSTYSINQINYRIDKQGRLLDSAGYILLDYNNKEVRLNQGHLRKLAEFGLLGQ